MYWDAASHSSSYASIFDFTISSVLTVTKLCCIAIKLNNKKTMKHQAAIGFDMHSYI